MLVTHTDYVSTNKNKTDLLTKLVDALKSCKLVTDTISIGDVKFMVRQTHTHTHTYIDICMYNAY